MFKTFIVSLRRHFTVNDFSSLKQTKKWLRNRRQ
nr:MAG TPA: hypothetical protein [Caudoviricetes sp.]DAS76340.1 MAG TPA: hypothetical protein [Caudoviricetes sp.]